MSDQPALKQKFYQKSSFKRICKCYLWDVVHVCNRLIPTPDSCTSQPGDRIRGLTLGPQWRAIKRRGRRLRKTWPVPSAMSSSRTPSCSPVCITSVGLASPLTGVVSGVSCLAHSAGGNSPTGSSRPTFSCRAWWRRYGQTPAKATRRTCRWAHALPS